MARNKTPAARTYAPLLSFAKLFKGRQEGRLQGELDYYLVLGNEQANEDVLDNTRGIDSIHFEQGHHPYSPLYRCYKLTLL
jgi:hypothetical protein